MDIVDQVSYHIGALPGDLALVQVTRRGLTRRKLLDWATRLENAAKAIRQFLDTGVPP